jgi:hypothetical protein
VRPLLIFLVGCGFAPHASTGGSDGGADDASTVDAPDQPVDAVLGDAPAVCLSWHPQHFQPCTLGSPMPMITLAPANSPYTYDTTTEGGDLKDKNGTLIAHSPITIQQADTTPVAIYSVAKFTLMGGAVLNVIGPKPLIIASWDTLDVMGDLDAGSHTTETDAAAHIQQTTQKGAGAATCSAIASTSTASAATPGQDAVLSGGSGGGGGGAFHGNGGDGTTGDQNCTGGASCPRLGGQGGTGAGMPATIHGGCAGAASGKTGPGAQNPATTTTVAQGGSGGGAIELAAKNDIHIAGTVRAGGAAGAGAPQGSAVGGGGGGAGGYVAFDGHMVALMGTVAANGGGGGASAPFAGFGNVGQDGQPSLTAANGGAAQPMGCGLGGAKGSSTSIDGANATGSDTCGGGGGGGGGGWVISWSTAGTSGTGVVSPPLTPITVI